MPGEGDGIRWLKSTGIILGPGDCERLNKQTHFESVSVTNTQKIPKSEWNQQSLLSLELVYLNPSWTLHYLEGPRLPQTQSVQNSMTEHKLG
jgi:hypothetical protein